MTKKQKFDEAGDSEDLQALFDSMSVATGRPGLEVVAASAVADGGGDDDALQALFDEVASGFSAEPEALPVESSPPAAAAVPADDEPASGEHVFNRIGVMTRHVHDTLRALGGDHALKEAVEAIPDARQRLNYIAVMTEQAASRVLNATDIAKPLQDTVASSAASLQGQWDKLFANQLSVAEFKALSTDTRKFLGEVQTNSHATSEQLMEIMMAQDFQDLTGQVIKKVLDLAQTLETELLKLLIEVTPPGKRAAKAEALMNGPVINSQGREDVVTSQEQVDDLLDSLGF